MNNFEYTDTFGDALKIKLVGMDNRQVLTFEIRGRGEKAAASANVVVPSEDLPAVIESIIEVSGLSSYVIPKSDDKVDAYRGWLYCGGGKEYVETPVNTNPEVLLKKAANLVAIAKEIQRRKGVAAAEQSLQARRDKVTQELAGNAKARYELATDLAKKAIDRIIATEDKKEEGKDA